MGDTTQASAKAEEPNLNEDIWLHTASFLWLDEQLQLQRVSRTTREAVRRVRSQATSLHASILPLHAKRRNTKKRKKDGSAVAVTLLQKVDTSIGYLVVTATNLKYLDLGGLRYLTGRWERPTPRFQRWPETSRTWLVDLFQSASQLVSLNLSDCIRFLGECFGEAIEDQRSKGRDLPRLKQLILTNCRRVDSDTIISIAESQWHESLETLHIGGCSQKISSTDLKLVAERMLCITSLDISALDHIQSFPLDAIPSLQVLVAAGCRYFSLGSDARDKNFAHRLIEHELPDVAGLRQYLADSETVLRNHTFANIKVINVNETPKAETCALLVAAYQSRQLADVSFSGCEVSEVDLMTLVLVCQQTLKRCCFRDCQREISGDALAGCLSKCKKMVELDLSECSQVSDANVELITSKCLHLRALRIAGIRSLTDRSLDAIGGNLKCLLLLDVHGCNQLRHFATVPPLIELDARETELENLPDTPTLRILNGRRIRARRLEGRTLSPHCIACTSSQRCTKGVEPMPMWHCRDCDLRYNRNRCMCGVCAVKCHAGHDIYMSSVRRYACDCAFGYGAVECRALLPEHYETKSAAAPSEGSST